ncbi:unnamed protein product [Amoebophrya sp. A25]|nr:unnamed protein product [Amoebophrya sp. A25]|eukprot:GSA25T00025994001.1
MRETLVVNLSSEIHISVLSAPMSVHVCRAIRLSVDFSSRVHTPLRVIPSVREWRVEFLPFIYVRHRNILLIWGLHIYLLSTSRFSQQCVRTRTSRPQIKIGYFTVA